MRMCGALGHYAYARYACVMVVRGDRVKDPKKGGARQRERSHLKEERQRKRRSKKVSNFFLFLVDIHLPQGLI